MREFTVHFVDRQWADLDPLLATFGAPSHNQWVVPFPKGGHAYVRSWSMPPWDFPDAEVKLISAALGGQPSLNILVSLSGHAQFSDVLDFLDSLLTHHPGVAVGEHEARTWNREQIVKSRESLEPPFYECRG